MTDEEAREVLKQIRKKKCVSECDYNCKLYESETFCLEEKALDMAIKVLEQQPRDNNWKFYYDHGYAQAKRDLICDDCISRKALIKRINNAEENFKADNMESIESGDGDPFVDGVLSGVFNIRTMVQQAPSVTPQQARWIPVSERLPEENIHVLCQFYMGGMAECYHAHNYWHIVGGFRIKIDDVLAWMPLPEPYKEIKNA